MPPLPALFIAPDHAWQAQWVGSPQPAASELMARVNAAESPKVSDGKPIIVRRQNDSLVS